MKRKRKLFFRQRVENVVARTQRQIREDMWSLKYGEGELVCNIPAHIRFGCVSFFCFYIM